MGRTWEELRKESEYDQNMLDENFKVTNKIFKNKNTNKIYSFILILFKFYLFLCALMFCLHACLFEGARSSKTGVIVVSCHMCAGN